MNAVVEVVDAVYEAEIHSRGSHRIVLLVTLDVKNVFKQSTLN